MDFYEVICKVQSGKDQYLSANRGEDQYLCIGTVFSYSIARTCLRLRFATKKIVCKCLILLPNKIGAGNEVRTRDLYLGKTLAYDSL